MAAQNQWPFIVYTDLIFTTFTDVSEAGQRHNKPQCQSATVHAN